MTSRLRGSTVKIEQIAFEMRYDMTLAERILWTALRSKQCAGLKFRAQHPSGRFILDFYCPRYKLVVELDGDVHDSQTERDADRTVHLNSYGYRVIRFRNEQVFQDLPAVLAAIQQHAAAPAEAC